MRSDLIADYLQNYSINYWITKGAPRNKILLGIPFFGRSFTLAKNDRFRLGSPTISKGRPGPFIQEPGSLAYHEVIKIFSKSQHLNNFDRVRFAPFKKKRTGLSSSIPSTWPLTPTTKTSGLATIMLRVLHLRLGT